MLFKNAGRMARMMGSLAGTTPKVEDGVDVTPTVHIPTNGELDAYSMEPQQMQQMDSNQMVSIQMDGGVSVSAPQDCQ